MIFYGLRHQVKILYDARTVFRAAISIGHPDGRGA
jgi:hypothetical protein